MTRLSGAALVVVIAMTIVACTGGHFEDPHVFNPPSPAEIEETMKSLGVTVVADVTSETGDDWLTITEGQLASMAAEASSRGGLTGSHLEQGMPPRPEGAPQFAFWVAAWLHDTPTERAAAAAAWYPENTDWSRALNLRFSRAVLLLFAADIAEEIDGVGPPLDPDHMFVFSPPGATPEGGPMMVSIEAQGVVGSLCSVISGFFEKRIGELFNQLKLARDWAGEGWLGFIGGILADLWNTVVDLVDKAVQAIVRTLTEPVLHWVGMAVAVAGVISHVSSYIDGWAIEIAREPESIHWGPPRREGLFRVESASHHKPWDADLTMCAEELGIELPEMLAPGNQLVWTVENPSMITQTRRDDHIPADRPAELRYETPMEAGRPPHRGAYVEEDVIVKVEMRTDDLDKVSRIGRALINEAIGMLVPRIPVEALRSLVDDAIRSLLEPVLSELEEALRGATGSLLVVEAVQVLVVGYHSPTTTTIPEEPPPTAPPPTAPPGEEPGPDPGAPDDGDVCSDGCAESIGDPHLTTLDGHHYTFQGAGEFVMLRSPDASLEVQVRYEPFVHGVIGHDVSIGTAVTARVGAHRVAWYEELGVLIDGQPVRSGVEVDLGAGQATVTRDGVIVRWNEGTTMYVFDGTVLVDPSPELRADGVGLAGTVTEGGLGLPNLPDGTTVPQPRDRDHHIEVLYRQFGPAWRVTSQTSLFDYLPGESPDSFFLADFPLPENVVLDFADLMERFGGEHAPVCLALADPVRADRCAFDVAVTGDEQWAFPYQTAERLLDDGETVLVEPSAPGRPGEPTLVVAGEIGGLALPLHAALTAPEGTILMARVTSCPASGAFRVNVGPRAPADALGSTIDLCGTDELLLLGQHDEFFPNEGYVWIPSDGTYDITISGRSNEPESSIEVAFYIDPTPTVVTGTGSALDEFSGTYRLEHIADTVVFALAHPTASIMFPSPEGMRPGEACGRLEYGASAPGASRTWPIRFCAHTDRVSLGLTQQVVPVIVFNRTNSPIDVTLGPPG